jgi:hypothetical protein
MILCISSTIYNDELGGIVQQSRDGGRGTMDVGREVAVSGVDAPWWRRWQE